MRPDRDNQAVPQKAEPESTDVVEHFTSRAGQYDRSSHWCTDPEMMRRIVELAAPQLTDIILDVACGTGLVSGAFRGKVAWVVGLDLTPAMSSQAFNRVDALVLSSAEFMPFRDEQFDLTLCRQGIQFMEAAESVREMVRVTKTKGRVMVVSLCAYGEDDCEEYFEILRLRNPARRNFFVPADLSRLLLDAGCREVQMHSYLSEEDVDVWSDNGAIIETSRERIRAMYLSASPEFRRLHQIQYRDDGGIVDRMLFVIAVGTH
jgi:SAM-dependent methyltransferase